MPQKYIVIFKNDAKEEEIAKSKQDLLDNGGNITSEYNMPNYKGYAAEIPDSFLSSVQSLQGGIIDIIEEDGVVRTQ